MGLSTSDAVGSSCLVAGLVGSGCTSAGVRFSCRFTEQERLCPINYRGPWSRVRNVAVLLLQLSFRAEFNLD